VFGFGGWSPLVHDIDKAVEAGFDAKEATHTTLIAFGCGSMFGRPVIAKVLEKVGRRNGFPVILFWMAWVAAATPGMCGSLFWIAVNSVFYGFGFGAFISILPPITAELVGMAKLPSALGLVYGSFGISFMIGPPMCGYMEEATGSYDEAYYMSGGVICLGALLAIPLAGWSNQLAPPAAAEKTPEAAAEEAVEMEDGSKGDNTVKV